MYQLTASGLTITETFSQIVGKHFILNLFCFQVESCPSLSAVCSLSVGLRCIYRVSVASDCAGCRVLCVLLMSAHSV